MTGVTRSRHPVPTAVRRRIRDIRPAAALAWGVLAIATVEVVNHVWHGEVGPPTAAILLGGLGLGLLASDAIQRSGRPRLAVTGAVVLLLAVAVVGGVLFPARASSAFAPLIAFTLLLPHLRGRQMAIAAFACAAAAGPLSILAEGGGALLDPAAYLDIGLAAAAATGVVALILSRQKVDNEGLIRRYSVLVEDLPVGLYRATREGRFLDVNPAFVDLLGYPDATALLNTSFPDLWGLPEGGRVLSEGDPGDLVVGEVLMRRRDGTRFWARHHTRQIAGPDGRTAWLEGVLRDITDERALRLAAERLAALVESANDAIIGETLDGTVVSWNATAERTYGWTAEEMMGASVERIVPPSQRAQRREYIGRLREGERVQHLTTERVDRQGRTVIVSLTTWPVRDEDDRIVGVAAIERDITEQRRLEAQLERRAEAHAAVLSSISRLAPRPTVEGTAEAICAAISTSRSVDYTAVMALRGRSEPVLLAAVAHHMPPGGAPVVGASHPLRPGLRTGSGVIRLTPYGHERALRGLYESGIRQLAHVVIEFEDRPVAVLLAGSSSTSDVELGEILSGLVDFGAMAGPLLGPQLVQREVTDLARARLKRVIDEEAFVPVFQPVVDIRSRAVLGYEALTRFTEGLPPDQAFAQACAVGLGLELETATLRAALAASGPLPANAFLDLNVSPSLILAVEPLRSILREWGWGVILEITEHDRVEDYDALRAALDQLGPNVRLAVDDAGAGFSSLKHIVELRPAFIKLDRGLVVGVDHDKPRQGLVAGMRHFAASIGCNLVAEGVETEEEAAMLLSLGVELGQGYLFGRPRPAA
jgi:PAS domain S-box-containing protein